MVQALVVAFTVFLGWTLLDYVKKKRLSKESIFGSLLVAVLAGIVWLAMEFIIIILE